MVPDGFRAILARNNIKLACVGCLADGSIERIGTTDELPECGLIDILFGDRERLIALDQSLVGQLLPRMWAQGQVGCVVCKPLPSHVVGLFYVETRDVAEIYRWSKAVDKEMAALFAKNE